jgi:ATP-binding protein involved in chromosome partitioning
MAELDAEELRAALRAVADPASGRDIVTAGLVEAVNVRGGSVQVALRANRDTAPAMEAVGREAEAVLRRVPGVQNVAAVLTAHREPAAAAPPAAPAPHAHGPTLPPGERLLAQVPVVIAVASGKGGVGKSTVAANLAVALAASGLHTGLLDADIFGPSVPRMLGVAGKPEIRGERMVPREAFGLRIMSIGFLVEEDTAMIWRGPMVMSALQQLLGQTEWGPLDAMVIDMPPGTGDVALTLAQRVHVTGAVIVSTPQDIALIDARRAVRMFEKTGVAILGLVENMSFFACPHCGERTHLFGHGGARAEAARLGVEFLGEVPLLLDIRMAGDAGAPVAAADPQGEAGRAFAAIAARVVERVTG